MVKWGTVAHLVIRRHRDRYLTVGLTRNFPGRNYIDTDRRNIRLTNERISPRRLRRFGSCPGNRSAGSAPNRFRP